MCIQDGCGSRGMGWDGMGWVIYYLGKVEREVIYYLRREER